MNINPILTIVSISGLIGTLALIYLAEMEYRKRKIMKTNNIPFTFIDYATRKPLMPCGQIKLRKEVKNWIRNLKLCGA